MESGACLDAVCWFKKLTLSFKFPDIYHESYDHVIYSMLSMMYGCQQVGPLCVRSRLQGGSQATGGAGLGVGLRRPSATTKWTSQTWPAS